MNSYLLTLWDKCGTNHIMTNPYLLSPKPKTAWVMPPTATAAPAPIYTAQQKHAKKALQLSDTKKLDLFTVQLKRFSALMNITNFLEGLFTSILVCMSCMMFQSKLLLQNGVFEFVWNEADFSKSDSHGLGLPCMAHQPNIEHQDEVLPHPILFKWC